MQTATKLTAYEVLARFEERGYSRPCSRATQRVRWQALVAKAARAVTS